MPVTVYEIPDLLTLLFAVQQYPHGFVAVGLDSNALFCVGSITTGEALPDGATSRMNLDAIKKRITNRERRRDDARILLYPNQKAFYEKLFDQTDNAPYHCVGCGRLLLDHRVDGG